CSADFKTAWSASGSRQKTLKNHLVGVARGPFALLRRAHGPGQERQAENMPGHPWCCRRQLVDTESHEMRAGAERVPQMFHAPALGGRCLGPVGFGVFAL